MDVRSAARRWARTWTESWEALDPEPIVALYAEGAIHWSEPFREPARGRDAVRRYVTDAFAGEGEPRVRMSEPIVDGERASISWWSALREDGADATLAGTSVLRFDAEGLVVEQWDAWNQHDRRADPPAAAALFSHRDA